MLGSTAVPFIRGAPSRQQEPRQLKPVPSLREAPRRRQEQGKGGKRSEGVQQLRGWDLPPAPQGTAQLRACNRRGAASANREGKNNSRFKQKLFVLCAGCRLILMALEALEDACWLVMATFVPPYTHFPPLHLLMGAALGITQGWTRGSPAWSPCCCRVGAQLGAVGDAPALFGNPLVTAEAFCAKQLPIRNSPIRFWNDLIQKSHWALHFFFFFLKHLPRFSPGGTRQWHLCSPKRDGSPVCRNLSTNCWEPQNEGGQGG